MFAWVLGLGVLFLSLYTSHRSAGNGTGAVAVLFGSVLGLSAAHAWLAFTVAAVVGAGVVGIARPLLDAPLQTQRHGS